MSAQPAVAPDAEPEEEQQPGRSNEHAQLSKDVLMIVFSYLPIAQRLRAESVCREWRDLLRTWPDISHVFMSGSGIDAASANFRSTERVPEQTFPPWDLTDPSALPSEMKVVPKVVAKCCAAKTLVLDNRLMVHSSRRALRTFKSIQTLVLADEFLALDFARRSPAHLGLLLDQTHLRSLYVVRKMSFVSGRANVLTVAAVRALNTPKLETIALQGLLLGPQAFREMAVKLKGQVTSLLIGGCVCQTRHANDYFQYMGMFEKLTCLQIPSSLFSFSRMVPTETSFLSKLKHLQRLELVVLDWNKSQIQKFIQFQLPHHVKILILFGHGSKTGVDLSSLEKIRPNLKVAYSDGDIGIEVAMDWMAEGSVLEYKPFWLPPYFHAVDNHHIPVSNDMLNAQRRNPEFISLELEQDELNEDQVQPESEADDLTRCSGSTQSSMASTASEPEPDLLVALGERAQQ